MSKRTTIVLLSLISLILIIGLGASAVNRVRTRLINNLVDQYYAQEQVLAEETANLIKGEVVSMQDKLQLILQSDEVNKPTSSTACNLAIQNSVSKLLKKPNNVGRVGANGNFLCSLNTALIGAKASNFGTYINDIFNDPSHKPVMSRATKVPNVEGFIFAVHIPVFTTDNAFDGTIGGAIYFNQLQQEYLENIQFPNQGYVAIYDDNYDLLYHPRTEIIGKNLFGDELQNLLGRNETLNQAFRNAQNGEIGRIRNDLDGVPRVSLIYPVEIFPGRKWIIVVVTPVAEIENTLINTGVTRDFVGLTIFLIILIAITPMIILIYLNRTLFRPMFKVTDSIKKVSEGNFDQQVNYKAFSSRDEIGQLTNAFNKMAAQLKDLYQNLNQKVKEQTDLVIKEKESLEQKVAERTEELNNSKQNLESEVAKQTAELREKVQDLQKFNEVMVNRESRIVELKEEVKKLEDQLTRKNAA